MRSVVLNIGSDALVAHTATLEKLHRSALPVAIRGTLNRAAFDVKKVTMPKDSDVFTHRNKTFFKSNSKVEPAKGFEVASMSAVVGFVPKANDKSHSVEDLQEQEHGGAIKGRAFVATPAARVGNKWQKNVAFKNRMENIRKKIVDPRNNYGKGKSNWVSSAVHAGVGGVILNQDHDRLLLITGMRRKPGKNGRGKDMEIDTKTIETVKKGREAHVRATHFMQKASEESADKMDGYYAEEMEKQVKRLVK